MVKRPRPLPAVVFAAALGLVLLVLAQASIADDNRPLLADRATPERFGAESVAEIQLRTDFDIREPGAVPADLEFAGATVYKVGNGQYVDLVYRGPQDASSSARSGPHGGILITQSADGFTYDTAISEPVTVNGVNGRLVRGETIDKPGLLSVYWQKDGITFRALAFPSETLTDQGFLELLDGIQ
jgi:hypothetical protein